VRFSSAFTTDLEPETAMPRTSIVFALVLGIVAATASMAHGPLLAAGHDPEPIDRRYGLLTSSAILAYQHDNQLAQAATPAPSATAPAPHNDDNQRRAAAEKAHQDQAAKAASDAQQDQARRGAEDKTRQDQINRAAGDRYRAEQDGVARAQAERVRQQEGAATKRVERPQPQAKPLVPR
jgi:hypothetical protein